jgi:hypothetical protein
MKTDNGEISRPPGAYSNLALRQAYGMVDRAGFEPAALRSRVSAFPHSGSNDDLPSGRSSASPNALCTRLIYRPTKTAKPEDPLLNWFCFRKVSELMSPVRLLASGHIRTTKWDMKGQDPLSSCEIQLGSELPRTTKTGRQCSPQRLRLTRQGLQL